LDEIKVAQPYAIICVVFHESEQYQYDNFDQADVKLIGESQDYEEVTRQLRKFHKGVLKREKPKTVA